MSISGAHPRASWFRGIRERATGHTVEGQYECAVAIVTSLHVRISVKAGGYTKSYDLRGCL